MGGRNTATRDLDSTRARWWRSSALSVLLSVVLIGALVPSARAQVSSLDDSAQDLEEQIDVEKEGPPGEVAGQSEKEASDGDDAVEAAPASNHGFRGNARRSEEIERLRSRTSRTFANSYGAHETEVFTESIHYRDNGRWRRVDNTLVASDRSGYAYQNRANRYRVHLPPGLGNAPVRITRGGDWISFKLAGASGQVSASENRATAQDALPGVDVAYIVDADAVKEELYLKGRDATRAFEWRLQLSPGLSAEENSTGGVDIRNASGRVRFRLPQPFIHDASGSDEGIAPAHELELASSRGRQTVRLEVDSAWLADPQREFPVTVDPTTTVARRDCWITDGDKSGNTACGANFIHVGYNGNYRKRGLIKFDLSQSVIPENAEILHAEAALHVDNVRIQGPAVGLAFRPLIEGWNNNVTWDERFPDTPWSRTGGTFDGSSGYRKVDEVLTTGWHYWHPTPLVKRWVSGDLQNAGALIKLTDRLDENLVWFASSDNDANRPKMTVTWDYGGMGKLKNYKLESRRLTDRMQVHANVAGGSLLVEATDLKIRGTGLDLEIKRHYNSLLATEHLDTRTDVGEGWNLSTAGDIGLRLYRDGSAAFFGPSGYRVPFYKKSTDGEHKSPSGPDADLHVKSDGSGYFVQFRQSKERFHFDADGHFTAHEDKSGNTIQMHYGTSGKVERITDTQGRDTFLNYNSSGQLDDIVDPNGRMYDYIYNGGRLIEYKDPELGSTHYDYGTGEDLEEIRDPSDNETQFDYNLDGWITMIRQVTDRAADTGDEATFDYFADSSTLGCIDPAEAPQATRVVDAREHMTKYCYTALSRVREIHDAKGNLTTLDYNSEANVTRYVNPKKHEFGFQYDQTGQDLEQTVSPSSDPSDDTLNGAVTSREYGDDTHDHDGNGISSGEHKHLPTKLTTAEGKVTKLFYDANHRLTKVQQDPTGDKVVFSYEYNGNGTLARIEAPPVEADGTAQGNDTTFEYDARGNLTRIVRPQPMGPMSFEYDSLSRITATVDGAGRRTEYDYDNLDRITDIRYFPPGSAVASGTVGYKYDSAGNLTEQTDTAGDDIRIKEFRYDAKNQLESETRDDNSTVTYGYNAVGDLNSVDEGGAVTKYRYDVTNVMDQITEPDGDKVARSINKAYDPYRITFPNDVKQHIRYHPSGNISEIRAERPDTSVFRKSVYDYTDKNDSTKEVSLLQKVTDRHGRDTVYDYDGLGRLTNVMSEKTDGSTLRTFKYRYDANTNLIFENDDGTTIDHVYNDANQLKCSYSDGACDDLGDDIRYDYDGEGNLTSQSDGRTIDYDPARGFTETVDPAEDEPVSFEYEGPTQEERVTKTTSAGETRFKYDLLGLGIEERPGATLTYVRDDDGKPLGHTTTNTDHYYITDHVGTVTDVTDKTGEVEQKYTYDPYGATVWEKDKTGALDIPWRFAQGYRDYDGVGLQKHGVRFFDPNVARFTQLDPLFGQIDQPITLNRYQYAGCNPVNNVDPTGRFPCGAEIAMTTAAFALIEAIIIGGEIALHGLSFATILAALGGPATFIVGTFLAIAIFAILITCEE